MQKGPLCRLDIYPDIGNVPLAFVGQTPPPLYSKSLQSGSLQAHHCTVLQAQKNLGHKKCFTGDVNGLLWSAVGSFRRCRNALNLCQQPSSKLPVLNNSEKRKNKIF